MVNKCFTQFQNVRGSNQSVQEEDPQARQAPGAGNLL